MKAQTIAYRKELADKFLHVLEEKQLNWKQGWTGGPGSIKPVNAKSKAAYKGINRLKLMLISMERGYQDNRWATYCQIQELGYRLKNAKGQGVTVEYWYPYDRKERHAISWEQYRREYSNQENGRYLLLAKYSTVFHGSLIEGLPKQTGTKHQVNVSQEELVAKISKNMQVPILHDGGGRAFYRPSEDAVHLPMPLHFVSTYEYNATALHELSHATGAESRLNRDMGGGFGTESYAMEELVAEITSCFLSGGLQISQSMEHVKNHMAYVQDWVKRIRKQPEALVKAVADAEKASAYMEKMAGLISLEEYEKVEASTMEVTSVSPGLQKKEPKRNQCGPKL